MTKLKPSVTGLYSRELQTLSPQEIENILQRGRKWDLSSILSQGGSIIFPHTLIRTCGDQIAAVVHACLDSRAPRVIVLGVIHSLDHTALIAARKKARAGEDISQEPFWGVFGPHFPGDETWKVEYSLENFCFLWDHEIKRRQIQHPPELILAYPCLTNKEPWKMPGIEKLRSYLPESAIVATADLFHHGLAYGMHQDQVFPISKKAEQFAKATIEKGLEFFKEQNYPDYYDYSYHSRSDGADVGQLLMYLKGPLKSKILDIRLVDVVHLYEGNPFPSWVAASLIELTPFSSVFNVVN